MDLLNTNQLAQGASAGKSHGLRGLSHFGQCRKRTVESDGRRCRQILCGLKPCSHQPIGYPLNHSHNSAAGHTTCLKPDPTSVCLPHYMFHHDDRHRPSWLPPHTSGLPQVMCAIVWHKSDSTWSVGGQIAITAMESGPSTNHNIEIPILTADASEDHELVAFSWLEVSHATHPI